MARLDCTTRARTASYVASLEPSQRTPEMNREASEEIAAETKAFLKCGGRIQKLPGFKRKPHGVCNNHTWG